MGRARGIGGWRGGRWGGELAAVVVAEAVVDVAVAVDVGVVVAAVGVVNLLVSNDKNHPVPHQVNSTVFTVYCIKSDNY